MRNRDECDEDERNSHVNGQGYRVENRREDEKDNFQPNRQGDRQEDAGELSRIIAKLDRRC
jgi:hypothetical protein